MDAQDEQRELTAAADAYWAPLRQAMSAGLVVDDAELLVTGPPAHPDLVLSAYRHGLFPMGAGRRGGPPMGWWSPNPRGVLRPGELRVSRSLRRSVKRLRVTVDTDFVGVLRGCADPGRDGAWITPQIEATYTQLHRRGHAHSVEVWEADRLVGGLYGIGIGGLFAGESMFHHVPDASKVALVHLVERVFADGDPLRLIDVQWLTAHLSSLGCRAIPRPDYLHRLAIALALPAPAWGCDGGRRRAGTEVRPSGS